MLDKYIETQPIAYKILKNAVSKDKYSHAYLFETNGFYDSEILVMNFVKSLLCPKKQMSNDKCKDCNQCHVIDSGNFPEIKIIEPDGLWIKKGKLKELQNEFNKKAIIGNKKIYIIKEANKLNKESANSILKFLEEPEEGIIAILITDNLYGVLETIRSRCQIISLKEDKSKKEEFDEENVEKIIKFIKHYEQNHLDTILYMQKLWHDNIKTKEELEKAFKIIILFYKDILNYLTGRKIENFEEFHHEIKEIAEKNTLNSICNKLNILTEFKEKIKYNANTFLLMDKLIITLEGR